MPAILYGTAWKKERTAELVEQAVTLGFRGIDTACQPKHYDEPGVGRGLTACLERGLLRSEVYLQSKFTPVSGQDPRRVPYDVRANLEQQVRESFQASLRNLGTDYLDGLILHSPISPFERTLEVWRVFEGLVDEQRVASIGISNCYELGFLEALWNAARVKPAIVQNRFYAKTRFDREIRAYCRARGMRYQSFWTLTANPQLLEHPALVRIAEERSLTPAQVLLRCLIQVGITPLSGTTSERHMVDDLAILGIALSEREVADVVALFG